MGALEAPPTTSSGPHGASWKTVLVQMMIKTTPL